MTIKYVCVCKICGTSLPKSKRNKLICSHCERTLEGKTIGSHIIREQLNGD